MRPDDIENRRKSGVGVKVLQEIDGKGGGYALSAGSNRRSQSEK